VLRRLLHCGDFDPAYDCNGSFSTEAIQQAGPEHVRFMFPKRASFRWAQGLACGDRINAPRPTPSTRQKPIAVDADELWAKVGDGIRR